MVNIYEKDFLFFFTSILSCRIDNGLGEAQSLDFERYRIQSIFREREKHG